MGSDLNRRDFNRLAASAFGGVVAGSLVGCGGGDDKSGDAAKKDDATKKDQDAAKKGGDAVAGKEKHVCRGLNSCKGKGRGGDNACAGQGKCASVADHECGTKNACAGEGGCGSTIGTNECKGKGSCEVPLMPEAWKSAREKFEAAMKAANTEFGDAPPAPAKS